MKSVHRSIVFFGTGAYFYGIGEVVCRGYTHWSMLAAGGICFILLAAIAKLEKAGFFTKCLLGAAAITAVEFMFGCVFNILLQQNVWDYTDETLNIMGQVCPRFFGLWFIISGIGITLAEFMSGQLERKSAFCKKTKVLR